MQAKERSWETAPLTCGFAFRHDPILDEAALLLDLKDVYWAKQGRTSVDLAVGLIAVGGVGVAGMSLWSHAVGQLHR